jgi:hypothetical protein
LYLWWLGILLFDLAFVWHRYVRNAVAVDALRQWAHGRDASPDPADRAKPIGGGKAAGAAPQSVTTTSTRDPAGTR